MAKLSAYGRTEVTTFTKFDATTPDSDVIERRTKLRLMSDGQILIKVDAQFRMEGKLSWPWKKWAKMKNWHGPEVDAAGYAELLAQFETIATKRGFVRE